MTCKDDEVRNGVFGTSRVVRTFADKKFARMGAELFPCMDDINELSHLQPMVHRVLSSFRGTLSEEQQLCTMVLALSAQVEELIDKLTEASIKVPSIIKIQLSDDEWVTLKNRLNSDPQAT